MAKTALITGVTGQDGYYLSELLLGKGYEVHGLMRKRNADPGSVRTRVIEKLDGKIIWHYGDIENPKEIRQTFKVVSPDEIYHLAGQKQSKNREEDMRSFSLNLGVAEYFLDAIRDLRPETRFFMAGSSEMFGRSEYWPANESTPFSPLSPYAESKVKATELIRQRRSSESVFAVTGIFFNHESPYRDASYVTRKITIAAARAAKGRSGKLILGDMSARRDWGYAPEYMEAAWLMMQQEKPDDYVIGTGVSHTVEDFARLAFETVGLDWKKYVDIDTSIPASEIPFTLSDPAKIADRLGWKASTSFRELVEIMINAELALLSHA